MPEDNPVLAEIEVLIPMLAEGAAGTLNVPLDWTEETPVVPLGKPNTIFEEGAKVPTTDTFAEVIAGKLGTKLKGGAEGTANPGT